MKQGTHVQGRGIERDSENEAKAIVTWEDRLETRDWCGSGYGSEVRLLGFDPNSVSCSLCDLRQIT